MFFSEVCIAECGVAQLEYPIFALVSFLHFQSDRKWRNFISAKWVARERGPWSELGKRRTKWDEGAVPSRSASRERAWMEEVAGDPKIDEFDGLFD